jgi:pimeloyl-ACP methyl ester carboxylesterase
MAMNKRAWGRGEPVVTLHPLGLDSSAFAGFGRVLARRGLRTIAVDLPGFGKTPGPDAGAPLTPALLAEPVIAMARRMKSRPALVGISMGGRVALEAALTAPEAFRSVIAIAPYLPWRRFRPLLQGAHLMSPRAAEWIPLERLWPALRRLAQLVERTPYLREDELAQAGARLIYYLSCPATRVSLISAAREMALDPAFGPRGLWTRLPDLAIPAAFAWGERDRLVSSRLSDGVRQVLPDLPQLLIPCLGHALNGPHHRCLAEAVASLLDGPIAAGARRRSPRRQGPVPARCLVNGSPAPGRAARASARLGLDDGFAGKMAR